MAKSWHKGACKLNTKTHLLTRQLRRFGPAAATACNLHHFFADPALTYSNSPQTNTKFGLAECHRRGCFYGRSCVPKEVGECVRPRMCAHCAALSQICKSTSCASWETLIAGPAHSLSPLANARAGQPKRRTILLSNAHQSCSLFEVGARSCSLFALRLSKQNCWVKNENSKRSA